MKFHRISALLLKFYYITINRVDRLFDIFYWPIIDIFVWGFASFYIRQVSEVNMLSMFLGGIILWMFVWRSAQDIAVFVLEDFWSRNLYHMFSSPVRISENVIAIIIIGFTRSIATFFVMAGLAFLFYAFNIFTINPLFLAASIAILSLFGFVVGMFITSFILRFGQRIQVLAWSVVWAIQPFSCVFYPLSSLPGWAASIARVMPTTHIFENLRALFFGKPVSINGMIYSLAACMLLLVLASFLVDSSFQKARETGLLAKGD
ncbi:ABC transporter permease [Candidatus Woesearchaeota archaeon]|nr:ABC transporter permease [Candidatus Woesearchaeota archaeon]